MKSKAHFVSSWLALAALLACPAAVKAQLEKMADFGNVVINGTYISGSSNPYDTAIQIGNDLWFTTQNGGVNDAGTVSRYNLTSRAITAVASLGSAGGGDTPQSSLTRVGDNLYFTTSIGGVSGTGTISYVNVNTGAVTTDYSFGPSTAATNPRTPVGGLTPVNGNDASQGFYFTTSNGGAGGSAFGAISKYVPSAPAVGSTPAVAASSAVVYNFPGASTANPNGGRQPMEGFTSVNGKLYFTTFTGGSNPATATSFANGAGTLGVFDPANVANPVTGLKSLGNTFYNEFPAHNPTLSKDGKTLYFTTVGNTAMPGSLQAYNLATDTITTLYSLASPVGTAFPADGRGAYGPVTELNNVLYFTTITGGLYNRGTIDAFDLGSNQFIKLFDLDGGTIDNRSYLGQEIRGGFTVVNEGGKDYLYLMARAGGATNEGTVLRLTPIVSVPEPGTAALLLVAGAGGLWWRRRSRRQVASGAGRAALLIVAPHGIKRAGSRRNAFTLIELLVVISVIAIVTSIALPVLRSVAERGREAFCTGNLRQIGAAFFAYTQDHDNNMFTADAIGTSSYRTAEDPMGLPKLFEPYVPRDSGKVWLCPAGRPTLKEYGNNYAWTRATNVLGKPVTSLSNLTTTVLVWDNFTMTLPSANNVPEPNGGPAVASVKYRYYPHRYFTLVNYLFADGHVGTP